METVFWIGLGLIVAFMVFAFGYLTAAKEFGKDVRFYKDCVRTLRAELYKAEAKRFKDDIEDEATKIYPGLP